MSLAKIYWTDNKIRNPQLNISAKVRAFGNTLRSRKLMDGKRWKTKVIFGWRDYAVTSTTGRSSVVYAIIKSRYITDNISLITRDRRDGGPSCPPVSEYRGVDSDTRPVHQSDDTSVLATYRTCWEFVSLLRSLFRRFFLGNLSTLTLGYYHGCYFTSGTMCRFVAKQIHPGNQHNFQLDLNQWKLFRIFWANMMMGRTVELAGVYAIHVLSHSQFEVRSFTLPIHEIIGVPKKLDSPWIRPRSLFSNIAATNSLFYITISFSDRLLEMQ